MCILIFQLLKEVAHQVNATATAHDNDTLSTFCDVEAGMEVVMTFIKTDIAEHDVEVNHKLKTQESVTSICSEDVIKMSIRSIVEHAKTFASISEVENLLNLSSTMKYNRYMHMVLIK